MESRLVKIINPHIKTLQKIVCELSETTLYHDKLTVSLVGGSVTFNLDSYERQSDSESTK